MKLSIYKNLYKITDNWHDGGGLVIVANSAQRAWTKYINTTYKTKKDIESILPKLPKPDFVYEVEDNEEKVIIFPNAGCC